MDIAEFLTARLDEAAERAEYAQTVIGGDWDGWEPIAHQLAADCDTVPNVGRLDQHLQHNADPARVLRKVEIKRGVIKLYEANAEAARNWTGPGAAVLPFEVSAKAYFAVLRLLAAAYADHPDYKASWKP